MPEEIPSWEWYDHENGCWQTGDGSVRVETEAEHKEKWLTSMQQASDELYVISNKHVSMTSGTYLRVSGKIIRDTPVWKHEFRDQWVFLGSDERWYISGMEARDCDFRHSRGWIHCFEVGDCSMPHKGLRWMHAGRIDESIVVTPDALEAERVRKADPNDFSALRQSNHEEERHLYIAQCRRRETEERRRAIREALESYGLLERCTNWFPGARGPTCSHTTHGTTCPAAPSVADEDFKVCVSRQARRFEGERQRLMALIRTRVHGVEPSVQVSPCDGKSPASGACFKGVCERDEALRQDSEPLHVVVGLPGGEEFVLDDLRLGDTAEDLAASLQALRPLRPAWAYRFAECNRVLKSEDALVDGSHYLAVVSELTPFLEEDMEAFRVFFTFLTELSDGRISTFELNDIAASLRAGEEALVELSDLANSTWCGATSAAVDVEELLEMMRVAFVTHAHALGIQLGF